MKKILRLWLLSFIVIQCAAAQFSDFDPYQETISRVECEAKISNYLLRDAAIGDFYTITDIELVVFQTPEKIAPEFVLKFGTKPKPTADIFKPDLSSPKPLEGVRIAIDPGHLGGPMARTEERFIDMELAHKDNMRVQFDEGTLALMTAKILRCYLIQAGAEVLLTRDEPGQPVCYQSFSEWCNKEFNITDAGDWLVPKNQQRILDYLASAKVPGSSQQELKRRIDCIKCASINKEHLIKQALFRLCYNFYDLIARADKINAFAPHTTIIIHYNAREIADASSSNYNLTFIPGNFLKGQLETDREHYEFMRLILNEDLERSLLLSTYITHNMQSKLDVPLMNSDLYQPAISRRISSGVYCRNLFLTRLVHSPLCYGETLIQNNPEEAERLAQKTIPFNGVLVSARVVQVAQAYFQGICQYFGFN